MEDKNVTIETVENEDGTLTTTITEPAAIQLDDQTDVIPNEETEDSDGKLGLAVLGLGAAAIGGLIAVGIKKHKDKKAAKEAQNPDGSTESEKPKKGKRIKAVTKGRKLTLAERIHGCELNPVEPEEDAPAEEDEA